MIVDTYGENMRTSSCLRILYPTAFSFKDEGFLATHPPSCHPHRVFGCPESERKWEKNERNWRKSEKS